MNNRNLVKQTYINNILNNLDYESQRKWLYEILNEEYDRYSDEELETEIISRYGNSWFSENSLETENQENLEN